MRRALDPVLKVGPYNIYIFIYIESFSFLSKMVCSEQEQDGIQHRHFRRDVN